LDGEKGKLTKIEMRVMGLVATSGFNNKEIANRLSIGERTVKAHLSRVFAKLGLQSEYQLIVYSRKLKHKA